MYFIAPPNANSIKCDFLRKRKKKQTKAPTEWKKTQEFFTLKKKIII